MSWTLEEAERLLFTFFMTDEELDADDTRVHAKEHAADMLAALNEALPRAEVAGEPERGEVLTLAERTSVEALRPFYLEPFSERGHGIADLFATIDRLAARVRGYQSDWLAGEVEQKRLRQALNESSERVRELESRLATASAQSDHCEVCGVHLMPEPARCEDHTHTEPGDPEWEELVATAPAQSDAVRAVIAEMRDEVSKDPSRIAIAHYADQLEAALRSDESGGKMFALLEVGDGPDEPLQEALRWMRLAGAYFRWWHGRIARALLAQSRADADVLSDAANYLSLRDKGELASRLRSIRDRDAAVADLFGDESGGGT